MDNRGRQLTPCRRKVAEREVRLNRAKWIGPNRIRLRFDPFAYRYIRLKVLQRDNHMCYWCGQPGDTMDHVIPWSKGGRTTMDNCICACSECNGERGDMPAAEFARLRGVSVPRPAGPVPAGPVPASPVAAAPAAVAPLAAPKPRPAERVAVARPAQRAARVAAATSAPRPARVAAAHGMAAVTVVAEEPAAVLRPFAMRDLLDPFANPLNRRAYQ